MILVTLGTQDQKMYRLLDKIEKSNIKDKIVVQAGGSADYKSEKMEIFKFLPYEEMDKLIDEADIVITHGGTGSIITPISKNKKVIAMARLEKYHEHINDHQKEIVSIFAEEDYIKELKDEDDLDELIKIVNKWTPKKYISNTENFIKNIKREIDC